MWYGCKKTSNPRRMERNSIHRKHLRNRRVGKLLTTRNPHPQIISFIKIPLGWKFLLLSRTVGGRVQDVVYAYTGLYFINFALPSHISKKSFDPQLASFSLVHPHVPYCYESYVRILADLFARFNRPALLKIRFKGKGYYMYKNRRNTIAPQFGYAHRVYVYASAASVLFLSKTKILLFGLCRKDILQIAHEVKAVKPINIFTGRGVRFAKQIIYKKTGKVSSYR